MAADGRPVADLAPELPAAATGLGELPGDDIAEAVRIVVGELPELPFLPQLPERGAGADLAGRTLGLLVDIFAEVVPSGWRVSRRPTRDVRRAKDFLAWDLDALEQFATGAPALKVQVCGPLTLGALVEVPSGNRALTDPGAMRDLTASLAEGVAGHLAELRRRLPGTAVVLQLDEPELAAVLAGSLPTASGLATVRAIRSAVAAEHLATVLAAAGGSARVLDGGPAGAALAAGLAVEAIVVDFRRLGRTAAELDPIGEWLNRGRSILAGVVPLRAPHEDPGTLTQQARPISEPLHALGFGPGVLAAQILPTPAGQLSHAGRDWVPRALRTARDIARTLADGADGGARPELAGRDAR